MSFGRWLLIHSFSIFLVTVFVLGYVYREELQLEQVYRQILNTPDQALAEADAKYVDEVLAPESKSIQPPESAQASDSGNTRSNNWPQPSSVQSADANTVDSPPISVAREPAPMVAESLPSRPTVSPPVIEQSELLYKARKAYWSKDYEMAIFHYQRLIEEDGDNPDYIGELGNIYYSLNDFENAAQQFHQAAIILIARGKRDQAAMLLSPVTAMNRDLGDQLRQRLRQSH